MGVVASWPCGWERTARWEAGVEDALELFVVITVSPREGKVVRAFPRGGCRPQMRMNHVRFGVALKKPLG